jgi:hypothetical protein
MTKLKQGYKRPAENNVLQFLLYEKELKNFSETQSALKAAKKLNKKLQRAITYVGGSALELRAQLKCDGTR